jgi:phosphoribosylglycinamide formyltransferase-1
MNCAVFASGSGTTFQSLIDRWREGSMAARLRLFISNNSTCTAMQRARDVDIPAVHLPPSRYESEEAYTEDCMRTLRAHDTDMIVLAGYMRKIPAAVVQAYHQRILNIHPALLPAFGGKGLYGSRVHEAVLAYGAKVSGMTVHLVDEHYDHGPVVLQKVTDVYDDDTPRTLAARVHELECAWYWRCVDAVAKGSISVHGRRVCGDV